MNIANSGEVKKVEHVEKPVRLLAWSGLVFAVLQSICTAFVAASGLRFAIGLASFISAVVTSSPAQEFHRDAIRLPMLIFSLLGAGINFVVLWQVRRLRRRPASQWRIAPLPPSKRRMEHLQFALSVLIIIFVVAELLAHKHIHGTYL